MTTKTIFLQFFVGHDCLAMIINDNEGDLGLCMASRTIENGDKFALLYFNLNRSYKYIQTNVKYSKIIKRYDAA